MLLAYISPFSIKAHATTIGRNANLSVQWAPLLCVCKVHTQIPTPCGGCQEIRQIPVSTCRGETETALHRNAAKNEGRGDYKKWVNAFSKEVHMISAYWRECRCAGRSSFCNWSRSDLVVSFKPGICVFVLKWPWRRFFLFSFCSKLPIFYTISQTLLLCFRNAFHLPFQASTGQFRNLWTDS